MVNRKFLAVFIVSVVIAAAGAALFRGNIGLYPRKNKIDKCVEELQSLFLYVSLSVDPVESKLRESETSCLVLTEQSSVEGTKQIWTFSPEKCKDWDTFLYRLSYCFDSGFGIVDDTVYCHEASETMWFRSIAHEFKGEYEFVYLMFFHVTL